MAIRIGPRLGTASRKPRRFRWRYLFVVAASVVFFAVGTLPASALTQEESYGPGSANSAYGKTYSSAACTVNGYSGSVSVHTSIPYAYKDSGLYFYVQIYVKNHNSSQWKLMYDKPTGLIKTWTYTYDYINGYSYWMSGSAKIGSTTFTGAPNQAYDAFIVWWWRTPNGSWVSTQGFWAYWSVGDKWGHWWPAPVCQM